MYKYYSTQRPIMPGSYPRQNGKEEITNFDTRTFCEDIGRPAWGYIEYSEPILDAEAAEYELIQAKN